MARAKKQRIATEAAPAAFANPFAALDLPGREPSPEGRDPRPLRAGGSTSRSAAGPPASSRPSEPPGPAFQERLLLRRSTAHRGGKTVLVLEGFSTAWTNPKLEALLHDLKASLGCGGTVKDRVLELQGDQPDRLVPLLESRGFTIKRGW
jgi:translation initiation factor 1